MGAIFRPLQRSWLFSVSLPPPLVVSSPLVPWDRLCVALAEDADEAAKVLLQDNNNSER